MPRRSNKTNPLQHPLSSSEKISDLIFYETELTSKKCSQFTIQNLTKFYSDLIEYYDNIKDPITLYFKEKIQIMLSQKKVLKLLDEKEVMEQEQELYKKKQRRTLLTQDTKKELRSKMVDFNLKLSHAQNAEEDQKSIKNLLTNHQENYNKVHEHMKKELNSQEDMFRKKMEKRRERSMSRTLNKSKSANKKQKSKKNLGNNPPIKKFNVLDSLQKPEKKDNPFEK